MAEETFERGDRVKSTICGYYLDFTGHIIGAILADKFYYIVELDGRPYGTGKGKRIFLPPYCMKKVQENDENEP